MKLIEAKHFIVELAKHPSSGFGICLRHMFPFQVANYYGANVTLHFLLLRWELVFVFYYKRSK